MLAQGLQGETVCRGKSQRAELLLSQCTSRRGSRLAIYNIYDAALQYHFEMDTKCII